MHLIENGLKYILLILFVDKGLQNTAGSCAIVCCILSSCAFLLAIIAIVRKNVLVTMMVGVMHILIATYLVYQLAILYTKIQEESRLKNCHRSPNIFPVICSIRTVSYGHSLLYPLGGLFLTLCTGVSWVILFKIQESLETLSRHNY